MVEKQKQMIFSLQCNTYDDYKLKVEQCHG